MQQARLPEKDYTTRRGELSAYGRAVNSARLLRYLLIFIVALSAALLIIALLRLPQSYATERLLIVLAIATTATGFAGAWRISKEHFIDPDFAFRKWLQQVCDGDLDARIGLPTTHRHYTELDFHTRNLASALRQLSSEMESMVESQTHRLENQNRALELLFKVTSDVAGELDLQSVLDTVCTHLSSWLSDAPVAAYLLEGQAAKEKLILKAVASSDKLVFAAERPTEDLPNWSAGALACVAEGKSLSTPIQCSAGQCLRIPMYQMDQLAGMVEVIVDSSQDLGGTESQRIFQTISDQLSLFVARESALESAQNARLIKERNALGAEIHDSLAQTLLAARYQISLLRESLQTATPIHSDVVRIEGMIDEANVEVRGLIGEFRKPLSEHRHADTIQKVIDECNSESDIEVFFQLNNPNIRFTAREDSVVERIVSEALVNAKKYSQATMIRVYVRLEVSGIRSVLIEDDGVGFRTDTSVQQTLSGRNSNNSGNHIGLSVMRDRALSIGAILNIDSEPSEGTRVFLKLPPLVLLKEG